MKETEDREEWAVARLEDEEFKDWGVYYTLTDETLQTPSVQPPKPLPNVLTSSPHLPQSQLPSSLTWMSHPQHPNWSPNLYFAPFKPFLYGGQNDLPKTLHLTCHSCV